jgi:16S rRNA processing protein RimM
LDELRPGYVAVGRVLGPWGLRGEIKVEPLSPESTLAAGKFVFAGHRRYEIQESRRSGRLFRLKLSGVETREAAQALRASYLEVPEAGLEPLSEGQYYRYQLIGLAVRSVDGTQLGRVVDIFSTPENDVYVVDGSHGEVLLPAVDDVIRDINLAEGTISVEIIPGLLP